ncbi:protein transport protein Sec31A-like isoform X2 [Acanthaster planci]|uniref:Protein transport protein Sec31A n=1 Tax=Acanthaster planci TaxID=133434 RepID=A0A8B7ZG60_ACAPL|nr:protein transport protein Sec31A-like isoform X2 [Acanthaster planci]
MKVKEINRTANMAWSPAEQYPVYVAAGTAAQQLDATFSTSAALEIYALDLTDPSVDMQLKSTLSTEHRFHKVVWGKYGMSNDTRPNGVIVGGTDNGMIHLYDAAKLLENTNASITQIEKHAGAVKALDLNPFQANLLASGASESEIYIWDLNNLATPMTPGAKSMPLDEISCLAWNRQVQHILASTNPGGRCVVWDLRKNEPIIKVTDHSARIQCKAVAWHPEVATQMALASEDDHSPVVQIWDLRFATSPLKVLENHQRGVLSIAWCPQDPDLLLSCAKDNRILCWNPNSSVQGGEVVYELPTSSQWSFDVQWCPRNPAVIASSSFDGHVTFYSLMGGQRGDQQLQQRQADKIASSFPGTAGFGQQSPQQTQPSAEPTVLKKPPKWLRRPVGATFGFGGKLVSFQSTKQQPTNQVHISQVVTETELVNRSNALEEALAKGNFLEFCSAKISQSKAAMESQIWKFLKVNFEKDPRPHFVSLLGFDSKELLRKVATATGAPPGLTNGMPGAVNAEELAERMQNLDGGLSGSEASGTGSPAVGSKSPSDTLGDSDGAAAFDAIAAGGPVEVENQPEVEVRSSSPFTISRKDDIDGLISQAVLTGNFEAAVEMCLHNDRLADAILLAISGGPELLSKTQRRYFKKVKCNISRLISAVVTKDLSDIVECCDLSNWKETLTALLTYASVSEFTTLCDALASRLESDESGDLSAEACLCYICSGNVDKLVACWAKMTHSANTPLQLQDLVEKVMILRKALQLKTGNGTEVTSPVLAEKLTSYAQLLAAQGSLASATAYLGDSGQPKIQELRERLYRAQGVVTAGGSQRSVAGVAPTRQATAQPAGKSPFSRGNIVDPFKTTTVSSSQYYTSQVSATAQSSNYGYGQTQQPQVSSQQAAGDAAAAKQRHPSGDRHANLSGPRQYPHYQQGSMQQYYHQEPTQQQLQQEQRQAHPNPSMYNPAEYMGASTAPALAPTPLQQRTPGLAGYPQRVQPTSDAAAAPSSGYQSSTPAAMKPKAVVGAWNDPPLIKPKEQQKFTAPEPIMAPIVGGVQDPTPPHSPAALAAGEGVYNPAEVPAQQAPEPEVAKGPIPAEHQELADTYEGLARRCREAGGNNPQIKRKLDDVNKKLNILYDKLRAGSLSPMILAGLHEIASGISSYDYQTGLSVHKRLVSSVYFSEISSFMPGLKVLLQVSQQLRV